jgi:beta-fructofuranosidase
VTHELVQRDDGTLAAKAPTELTKAFKDKLPLETEPILGRWDAKNDKMNCDSTGRFSCLSLASMPDTCLIETNLRWKAGAKAVGLMLRADECLNDCFLVWLEPGRGLLCFDKWKRDPQYFRVERPVKIAGDEANVKVLVSGDVAVVYVDDSVALSARTYGAAGTSLGLFVTEGEASFEKTSLNTIGET